MNITFHARELKQCVNMPDSMIWVEAELAEMEDVASIFDQIYDRLGEDAFKRLINEVLEKQ